jgi:hypothetical protein
MKKIALFFILSFVFFSCKKDHTSQEDEYNLQGTGKIKTKYIYSSSSDSEPYATNSYSYDDNWNLRKILISNYPKPVFASYTYEYSDLGVLSNKKYNGIEGANYPNQTESDFILIREYKYSYRGNNKIELEYRKNALTDSVVYTYMDNLLVSEYHYDLDGDLSYNRKYEYDSDNKLIKETYSPEDTYIIYMYEGSRVIKVTEFDQSGSKMMENTYSYTKSDSKVIVELYSKDFLSEKTTYKDGNVIEEIKYHPTFQGAEWYCYRYEYYI